MSMNIQQEIQTAVERYLSGNLQEARDLCTQMLKKDPHNADVLYFLGVVYSRLEKHDLAITFIKRSLQENPNNADAYHIVGMSFQAQGKLDEAVEYYRKTIEHNPQYAEAYNNLGNVLKERKQSEEAIEYYQKAIELKPELGTAYYNLGVIAQEKDRYQEAVTYFKKALRFDPTNDNIYHIMGLAHNRLGEIQEAIQCFEKALQFNPGLADAYNNLGNTFQENGKPDDAEKCYRNALAIQPDFPFCYSNLLLTMNYNPRHDMQTIHSEHMHFAKQYAMPLAASITSHRNDRTAHRRLRVGYVSPDFRQHSVAYFIEPVLRVHNHRDFEIFCYVDVPNSDDTTLRIQGLPDHWRSIYGKSDEEVAAMIRSDKIDILADLAGHTARNRMLLFARKPAPVQVTWIGYPATTGLGGMDYKIVDPYTNPPGTNEQYYTEKLIRMPESFLCYLPDSRSPAIGPLPLLYSGHVTFGAFHNFARVSSDILSLWSKILKKIPNAHFVIKSRIFADKPTCRHILDFFFQNGIASDRIQLLPFQTSVAEHLDLYRNIDIGLDTFPYNGTTTTCEALWMGVPVISLEGKTYASRIGVGLLSNIGLGDLVAKTPETYVEIAHQLAHDTEKLQMLRGRLREMMIQSPLMNVQKFITDLEHLYRTIWKEWCSQ